MLLFCILWYIIGFIVISFLIYKHDNQLTILDLFVTFFMAFSGLIGIFMVYSILFGDDIVLISRRKK